MKKSKEIIYGINAIQTLINLEPNRIIEIFYEKSDNGNINPKIAKICELAIMQQISIQQVRNKMLDKWFEESVNHQKIVAHIKPKNFLTEEDLIILAKQQNNCLNNPVFLVLDNIQDPRNLGACIRSAAGFNLTAVIISRNHSCDITPVVKKVASGACELIPIAKVGNLVNCLKLLQKQGVWVISLAADHDLELSKIDLTVPLAVVLGSEHDGVRSLIKKTSDFLVKIPMNNKNMDSLNLSVAAGICLYEINKQKLNC